MDTIARLNASLVGRYRLEREIGAGGMARVYLAHDLRHKREVAVKVLNAEFGMVLGAERFLAEISVMAGLHHPHLLPLYDSGEVDGLLFYVMPHVQGDSLRTRLQRERQLPVHEAVSIAIAVASALDYAHRRGIVHRDLKPENILIHEGQPLVADFGIALAISRAGDERITKTGMSIGTPQYASPEQATAERDIDGRSDIYSLGAVLYEMLTADPPHMASTLQGMIARIMIDRPKDIRSLRQTVPEHVVLAVECALEKLPADRFATAQEFADLLKGGNHATPPRGRVAHAGGMRHRLRDPLVLGLGATALLALGAAFWQANRAPPPLDEQLTRLPLNIEAKQTVATGILGAPLALSVDGSQAVYLIRDSGPIQKLFLRRFAESNGSAVANTEGAEQPTFAPNGESVAFVVNDQLKTLRLGGSPKPIELGRKIPAIYGTSWGLKDTIIIGQGQGGLMMVPVDNRDPIRLTTLDTIAGERSHRWPVVLPDGKAVLFTVWRGEISTARIGVASISDGTHRTLSINGAYPLGVIEGHLVYGDTLGRITTVPVDLRRGEATGPSVPEEMPSYNLASGAIKAALSPSGKLIFQQRLTSELEMVTIVDGATRLVSEEAKRFTDPRISPSGTQVAVTVSNDSGNAVWVYDLKGGNRTEVAVGTGKTSRPEWTSDGKELIYQSDQDGGYQIMQTGVTTRQTQLLIGPDEAAAEAILAPENTIIYRRDSESRLASSIWWKSLEKGATAQRLIPSNYSQLAPALSPDRRWVAFASDSTGDYEIYVVRYPDGGSLCRISRGGGTGPAWSSRGDRIYFRSGSVLNQVSIQPSAPCQVIETKPAFDESLYWSPYHRQYDPLPNDGGFLALRERGQSSGVWVVSGWASHLRSRKASSN